MNQQALHTNRDSTAGYKTKTPFEQMLDHLQYPVAHDQVERRQQETVEHELLDEIDLLEIETHLMQYASEIEALAEKVKLTGNKWEQKKYFRYNDQKRRIRN